MCKSAATLLLPYNTRWTMIPRYCLVLALLTFGLSVAGTSGDAADDASEAEDAILFSYFKGNGESGVYLQTSKDGLTFEPVNDGEPIFTPPSSWPDDQQLTRDPSIVHVDGTFHMVWTTNWEGRVFGYAQSPDLTTWTNVQMVRPFPEDRPEDRQPNNVWAPELHVDPVRDDFFVVFSSTLPARLGPDGKGKDASGNNHRMYVVRTDAFESFTDAEVFYDPGFSSIDGQLVYDQAETVDTTEERWVMAFKHEQRPENGGKNIRLVFQNPETGAFSDFTEPVVGPGSNINEDWAEGPTLLKMEEGWRLYWDAYRKGYYGLARSADLEEWTDDTERLSVNVEDPRHGTFFRAPVSAVGWNAVP